MAPKDCYLLYHPRSRPSGRKLAAALGIPAGITLRGHRPEVVIRWGSQRSIGRVPKVINNRQALARAADKFVTLTALHEAGVPVPEFTLSRSLAWVWAMVDREPVLGRTRNGRGGNGIHVYMEGEEPGEHELYVKLVPANNEYRVHVIDNKVVRCQQKQATIPGAGVIRSHESGYVFVGLQSFRLNQARYDAAVEAVAVLGLDFGAVDLLIGEDNKTYVLEVNAAPGMSPLTLTTYANALGEMLNLAQWV